MGHRVHDILCIIRKPLQQVPHTAADCRDLPNKSPCAGVKQRQHQNTYFLWRGRTASLGENS